MDRMLERLKVLVVDDNHHMINIIKTILRGFEVKDFFDASNAAEIGVDAGEWAAVDAIIAEPGAVIGFAGPRVIKDTTQAELPPGFQTAEFLMDHGLIVEDATKDDFFGNPEARQPRTKDFLNKILAH